MAETIMRCTILAITIYLTHALAPPFTPPSVTECATFSATKAREVSLQQRLKRNIFGNIFRTDAAAKFIKLGVSASPRGSQNGNRCKRKRVRRVTYRKPPTVWVYPDKVEVLSYAEFWAMERAKMKAQAAWCVGRAVK